MPKTAQREDLLTALTSAVTDRSVVYFPHAGGSPISAARLAHECESVCTFYSVNYLWRDKERPGQQATPASCAAAVASAIEKRLPPRVVLYGHSIGAIIAWLVAMRLHECQRSRIELLILSGSPPWPAVQDIPFRAWSDDELRRHLAELDPDPPLPRDFALLDDTITAMVRTDYSAYERTTLPDGDGPACPCLVLGGDSDPIVPARNLIRWREFTRGATRIRIAPGGHFFNRTSFRAIAEAIQGALPPVRSGEPT